jgi:Protein of unknown function (DUF3040)
MGLGPGEQRLLGQIERALRGSDPKLAAKLATFNRLTFHEAMPLRERLLHPPSRVVRFAPLAMVAFVMFMLLISVTVLSRIGPAKASSTAACGIAWVQACQAAGASPHAVHGVVNVPR